MKKLLLFIGIAALLFGCKYKSPLKYDWDRCAALIEIRIENAVRDEPKLSDYYPGEFDEDTVSVEIRESYRKDLENYRLNKKKELKDSIYSFAPGGEFYRKSIVSDAARGLAKDVLRQFLPAEQVQNDTVIKYLSLIVDVYPEYAPEGYEEPFKNELYAAFLESWCHNSYYSLFGWDIQTPSMEMEVEELTELD